MATNKHNKEKGVSSAVQNGGNALSSGRKFSKGEIKHQVQEIFILAVSDHAVKPEQNQQSDWSFLKNDSSFSFWVSDEEKGSQVRISGLWSRWCIVLCYSRHVWMSNCPDTQSSGKFCLLWILGKKEAALVLTLPGPYCPQCIELLRDVCARSVCAHFSFFGKWFARLQILVQLQWLLTVRCWSGGFFWIICVITIFRRTLQEVVGSYSFLRTTTLCVNSPLRHWADILGVFWHGVFGHSLSLLPEAQITVTYWSTGVFLCKPIMKWVILLGFFVAMHRGQRGHFGFQWSTWWGFLEPCASSSVALERQGNRRWHLKQIVCRHNFSLWNKNALWLKSRDGSPTAERNLHESSVSQRDMQSLFETEGKLPTWT